MNEFYYHKPNAYSYRELNNNIPHIKFCTCVEKLQLHYPGNGTFILIILLISIVFLIQKHYMKKITHYI
jgi:hypothetical protein